MTNYRVVMEVPMGLQVDRVTVMDGFLCAKNSNKYHELPVTF